MSATSSDFLACAVECAGGASENEGNARSAVSRAYYAALHDCLMWEDTALPLKGYVRPDTRGTHNKLCERLATPEPTNAPNLRLLSKQRGYALRAFHTVRVVADYHLQEDVGLEDAEQAVADARRVIALV